MKEDHLKDQTNRPQGSAYSSSEASASLSPPDPLTSMTESSSQSNLTGESLTPGKKTLKEL